MSFRYAYLLPIIQGLWYIITFATTYTLSVLKEDVPAVFPYISDTGVWSIERCIFSFMLCIGSFLMFSILYIRYRQVKHLLISKKDAGFSNRLATLNTLSIYMAAISVVGLITLGTFQVEPFIYVHLTGASIAFTVGWFLITIQTYISYKIFPTIGSKFINTLRAWLVGITGLSLAMVGIFGAISLFYFKGGDVTQWNSESGGYEFHLVSSISEWFLAFGTVFYLTTYYREFKDVVLYKPKMELTNI
ncbi:hypothetical protein GWI33_004297 [Rhynchophorus ferrugineus]|uniref:CWH43-like N-terminal domain-containing protein n=1 Tax=Rhynchophorus ferrugineus TaxID=354439 RepID=A0A834ILN7_RHYFE|nr:hypothetical protein GWI33_004297 [Rhynchophorus ferrugineus]